MPVPRAKTLSPPPGAQAASHGAESRAFTADAPSVGHGRVAEAGPAAAGRHCVMGLGGRDLPRLDAEQDGVVHDRRLAGDDLGAGDERVLGEVRVDQEAAVVVRAAARCRRRVGAARQRELQEALTGAQWCARDARGTFMRRRVPVGRGAGCALRGRAGGRSGLVGRARTRDGPRDEGAGEQHRPHSEQPHAHAGHPQSC